MTRAELAPGSAYHVLFFDGLCGLCDRFVRFVLRRDRRQRFRFAPLQGALAARELGGRGVNVADLDSVYVLAAGGDLYKKSRAILFVLAQLGGLWWLLSLAHVVPRAIADWVYDRVASVRYRVFGKREACRLPAPEERARFLEATIDDPQGGAGRPAGASGS